MADVTSERSGQLVRAVFKALLDHPEGLSARDAIARAEKLEPPNEFEQSDYPSTPGLRRFDKIVRFSTIPSVKAGWLIKSKGTWILTPEGRAAYDRFTDPAGFMRESVRLYREWRSAHREEDDPDVDVDLPDDAERSTTFEEAEESAWAGIAEYLQKMPPYEFQELVASLLRAMGYHVPWVAPQGRDGGVDIVAFTDPIGATGPRIKVQVKRKTSGKIGVEGLRSFLAVLGSQDVGLFVSLGGFTTDAEWEARGQDARRLMLIDMERLVTMWIEHYDHLREEDKAHLPLRPVYFLSPDE